MIIIVIMGMVLIVVLFVLVYKNVKINKLDCFCFKDVGMVDLFNYVVMVDDGVIVGKNGLFMVVWFYFGDDNVSSID